VSEVTGGVNWNVDGVGAADGCDGVALEALGSVEGSTALGAIGAGFTVVGLVALSVVAE
jgi:hypothetical protein